MCVGISINIYIDRTLRRSGRGRPGNICMCIYNIYMYVYIHDPYIFTIYIHAFKLSFLTRNPRLLQECCLLQAEG